ncbi:hypothetical protein ACGYLO_21730 [Sulfitobacter sp. 1A13353]|uniref:hypothetical protein n=1 Tax=Sulfitobacter sp. 1A13353 TaxID=3368568 RepID=UPI0037453F7D
MKNSDLIYARLLEDALEFSAPKKRLATLERLKNACDLIAAGKRIPVDPYGNLSSRKMAQKINPSNIDRIVRAEKWTGPTRSFIANRANGLIDYVNVREEERSSKERVPPDTPSSQLESHLLEIESVEVRQIMRREIEGRRSAEREIKIIREGLKKLPQIDVRDLFDGPVTAEKMKAATATSLTHSKRHLEEQVRNLVNRLANGDLRRLGLKWDGEDIVTMSNAPLVLSAELSALIELAGLPSSLLTSRQ